MSDNTKNKSVSAVPKLGIFKRHPTLFRMTLMIGGMSMAYITMHLFFIDYLKKSDQIIQKEIQELKILLENNITTNSKANKSVLNFSDLNESKKL